ncbi:Z1 domain-containing protein [Sedimentibacter sp.]|uniref:Z1 domain-containing protein n=1 Tax=Sedimentibacter sp. TaxID=1960295 RepID=UPI00289ACC70|nr:Z1 domain-containing protein [Sedimentibacter sp.]
MMRKYNISELVDRVALDLRQRIDGTPTEEDLMASIDLTAQMIKVLGQDLNAEEKDKIKQTLLARIAVEMDMGIKIIDQSTYHPWLANRKAEIDEYYWNRYKEYLLSDKGWNVDVVDQLDGVGDDILDLLGNPEDKAPWSRKGLVLGDVQSGKTSNYIALINKAADAGYKLIILMSGTLEALRRQTQERIDEGFVGLNSRNVLKRDTEKKYVGVGRYDTKRTAYPFTDIISDFDVRKLQALGFSAKTLPEPIVFVIKKNTTVLKNLLSWINTSLKDTKSEKIDLPLLLIDDEADNASVNTKKPEHDPTAVNLGIRKILKLFNRNTYLAVTATPFANIFIDPSDEGEIADLFPSDFIYSLSPPSHYIGSNAIFGDDAKHENSIVEIDDADGVFASSDKSAHYVTGLPVSLICAINYFILCNVIRDINGSKTDHRSMLVNVSQYTFVQEQTFDLIDGYVDKAQKDIKHYSKLPFSDAVKNITISTLLDVWNEHDLENISGISFNEIMANLTDSAMPIKVTMVNTRTKAKGLERLDYEPYKENGYRVIAVGGNSLSRGITLEGLCVSYFYRNSKMYDTLLQMGRWFGYRPGYEKIFRIWMSRTTVEWYEFITKACNELRSEIAYMNKLGQKPSDFGLKVRDHPDTLMITAGNKMRLSKPLVRQASFNRRLIETPWLTVKTMEYNYKHTEEFILNITQNYPIVREKSNRLYSKIPCSVIKDYISNFASHPGHLVFNAREVGAYIEKNKDALGDWCVYIASGTEPVETEIAGITINRSIRGMDIDHDCIRIGKNKSRVGSVGTSKITLTKKLQEQAEDDYILERSKKTKVSKTKNPDKITVPDYAYLRYAKTPLLIIYFIACNKDDKNEQAYNIVGDKTIVGLGIGFPNIGEREEPVYYQMNMVEYLNSFTEYVDLDFEGDEDED